MTRGKPFEAEVLFLSPDDVPRAVEVLAMFGFDYKANPELIDPCGPTVFGTVTGTTELSENDIGDRLQKIVDPFGGDVIEWGYQD